MTDVSHLWQSNPIDIHIICLSTPLKLHTASSASLPTHPSSIFCFISNSCVWHYILFISMGDIFLYAASHYKTHPKPLLNMPPVRIHSTNCRLSIHHNSFYFVLVFYILQLLIPSILPCIFDAPLYQPVVLPLLGISGVWLGQHLSLVLFYDQIRQVNISIQTFHSMYTSEFSDNKKVNLIIYTINNSARRMGSKNVPNLV